MFLAFGSVTLGVLLLGGVTWHASSRTTQVAAQVSATQLPLERTVHAWRAEAIKIGQLALRATQSNDVFPVVKEMLAAAKAEDALVKSAAPLVELTKSEIREAVSGALKNRDDYHKVRTGVVEQALASQILSQKTLTEHAGALKAYQVALDRVLLLSETESRSASETIISTAQSAQKVVAGAVLGVLALAVLSGWLLRRSIVGPLSQASAAAREVASGNLSVSMPMRRDDEIGELLQALGDMGAGLNRVVREVRDAGEAVSAASSEVSSASHDLSRRTEESAAGLQRTTSSMEQLTSMVQANAASTQEAATVAQAVSGRADRSGRLIAEVVQTMSAIDKSSKRIADITGVIDSIAFQTNILALNAAVEAARAGEQGRGFSIVAAEVRNLAQRSATAAKEIKALITESGSIVESGTSLVNEAGNGMADLVKSVEEVTRLVAAISTATNEQSKEISGVSRDIAELDRITQQNTAVVEESAAAASTLKDLAQQLTQAVHVFKLEAHEVA